jgi:hypothetical protein
MKITRRRNSISLCAHTHPLLGKVARAATENPIVITYSYHLAPGRYIPPRRRSWPRLARVIGRRLHVPKCSAGRNPERLSERLWCQSGPERLRDAGSRLRGLEPLEDRGDALAATDAHRRQAVAAADTLQFGEQLDDEDCASGANWVAEGNATTVRIDFGRIER